MAFPDQSPPKPEVVTPESDRQQPFISDVLDKPTPVVVTPHQAPQLSLSSLSHRVVASSLAVVAFLVIGSITVLTLGSSHKAPAYRQTKTSLPVTSSDNLKLQDVLVNGQLYVNNGVVLKPSSQPSNPSLGQLYVSSDSHDLSYFNGTSFVSLKTSASPAETVLGVTSNLLKLGSGLTLNQNTIQNSGVTNLLGTQNQIAVSTSTGSVTLGLPSSVSIPGSLTSASLTTGNLVASNITATSLSGNGSGLTNLSGDNLTVGTIQDSRLTPNVALLAANDQVFHGRRQVFQNSANDLSAFNVQAADGTKELTVDTINHTVTTGDLLPGVGGAFIAGVTATNVAISSYNSNYVDSNNWTTVGKDGLMRFVYPDNFSHQDLHLIRCLDIGCTAKTNTLVVTGDSNWIDYPTLRMAPDGFPRIGYMDYANSAHYVQCLDADCVTKIDTVVDNDSYYDFNFVLDSNGFADIVNERHAVGQTTYIKCLDASCSTRTANNLLSGINFSSGGQFPSSIVLGNDGFPRVLFGDGSNPGQLHLVRCLDVNCSTTNTTTVFTSQAAVYPAEAFMGADGLLRIVLNDLPQQANTSGTIRVLLCNNADCTAPTVTSVATTTGGFAQAYLSVSARLGTDNLIRLIYNAPTGVHYVSCTDFSCSTKADVIIDGIGDYPVNIALDNANHPTAVDYNQSNNLFAQLAINTSTGKDITLGTNIGSSITPFGAVTSSAINTQQINAGAETIQGAPGHVAALFQVLDSSGKVLDIIDGSGNLTVIGNTQTNGVLQNYGGIFVNSLSPPGGVSVTNQGVAGSTTYTYDVTANNAKGAETSPSTVSTTTGNTTLNGANYNHITWTAVKGAQSYSIFRTISGGSPASVGLLGKVNATSALQFDDTGIVANVTFLSPTYDSTAGIYSGTTLTLQGDTNSSSPSFVKIGNINNGVQGNIYSAYAFSPYVTSGAILHQFDYNGLGSGPATNDSVYLASFTTTNSLNGAPQSVLSLSTSGKLLFGSAYDTALYRVAPGYLVTDGHLKVGPNLDLWSQTGAGEIGVPGNGDLRLNTINNGNVDIGTGNVSTNLLVGNSATINKNLNVSGASAFRNSSNSTTAFQIQNSSGTALLTADTTNMVLTVQALVINTTLTVNGHIITGGTTPGIVAGANAGSGATVSITGNDESGTITVNTGTTPTVGTLATITFASAYGAVPHIVLTPQGNISASLQYNVGSKSSTNFTLATGTSPAASSAYVYDYHIQQ